MRILTEEYSRFARKFVAFSSIHNPLGDIIYIIVYRINYDIPVTRRLDIWDLSLIDLYKSDLSDLLVVNDGVSVYTLISPDYLWKKLVQSRDNNTESEFIDDVLSYGGCYKDI